MAITKRLKIVSHHGVGYDSVNLPSLNKRGIALSVDSVSAAEQP
jgi:D-3-phosphoglycerate dehydrogenase